jgi:hypothetical protein
MILPLHNFRTKTVVEEWGECISSHIIIPDSLYHRVHTHTRVCVRSFLPEMPLRELYEILDMFANYQRTDSSE